MSKQDIWSDSDFDEFAYQATEHLMNDEYDLPEFALKQCSRSISGYQQTKGECLKQQMNNIAVCAEIHSRFNSRRPQLNLTVSSFDGSPIEIDENDIYSVFNRFNIESVHIVEPSKARLCFKDTVGAYFALASLNDIEIASQEIRMQLSWASLVSIDQPVLMCSNSYNSNVKYAQQNNENIPIMSSSNNTLKNITNLAGKSTISNNTFDHKTISAASSTATSKLSSSASSAQVLSDCNNNSSVKYTCRFEIQIPNDKDFQVARKIIGSRGENMKTIIKKCMDHSKKMGIPLQSDDDQCVKLRLRGKGSGYKEGPEKQESQEALHLCVSSMYYDMYKTACFFVEELLQTIYDEYHKVCAQNNWRRDRVAIKKVESTNGKGNNGSGLTGCSGQQQLQSVQNVQQQPQQQQNIGYTGLNYPQAQRNTVNASQQVIYVPVVKTPGLKENVYADDSSVLESSESSFDNNEGEYSNRRSDEYFGEEDELNGKTRMNERMIIKLIESRNRARKESNFQEADRIRNYLKNNGVALMDEKGGRGKGQDVTTWKYAKPSGVGSILNGGSVTQGVYVPRVSMQ